MRRIANLTAMAAAACVLIVQWTGLHMHVDLQGYIGVPETSYTHSHGTHGHDHGEPAISEGWSPGGRGDSIEDHDYAGTEDASLLGAVLTSFESSPAALILVFLFAFFPRVRTLVSARVVYPVLSGRYTRWRPPLRAPPSNA